jgi:amidohydrolase
MELKNKIFSLVKNDYHSWVEIRRHLHQYPELSMQEAQTNRFITELLTKWKIPFQTGIAKYGIVATLEGKAGAGKTLALRSDMDALPLQELNELDFISKNPGVMHACGHDIHMASLLGTIRILQQLREEFPGTVRCIFQPSEEKYPGGASLMIREGVLENPRPSAIIGQHTLPTLEAGKVGMRKGKYMASTDEIYLTVKGTGGHAATPELLVDPILISSHIIVALQQIVSRNATTTIPSVLSFGFVEAAGQTNIIPDKVTIKGTFRTYDENWRKTAHEKIIRMAQSIAEGMGGSCEVFIDAGYPYLVNEERLTERIFTWAKEYLGEENVVELDMRMTAEDFSYYSQIIPGCFYRLGVRNEALGITSNLHSQTFNSDEKSLETGAGLMAWLTIQELRMNES